MSLTYNLRITIYEGSNLSSKDSNGFSDPFCMVAKLLPHEKKINKKKSQKTPYCKKTLNPKWETKNIFNFTETISMEMNTLNDEIICIEVYDFDLLSKADFMGLIKLKVKNYFFEKTHPLEETNWYTLQKRLDKATSEVTGEIKVGINFEIKKIENKEKMDKVLVELSKFENISPLTKILDINSEFDINSNIEQEKEKTLLEMCILNENAEAIETLIKKYKVNVNKLNTKTKEYPLIHALKNNCKLSTIKAILLSGSVDVNVFSNDSSKDSPLHLAAQHISSSNDLVKILLTDLKMEPNLLNEEKENPIFPALRNQNFTCINHLLKYQSSLKVHNKVGDTILHVAIQSDTPEHVLLKFLSLGCSVYALNKKNQSPLSLCSPIKQKFLIENSSLEEEYGYFSVEKFFELIPIYKLKKKAIDTIWKKWEFLCIHSRSYSIETSTIFSLDLIGQVMRNLKLTNFIAKFANLRIYEELTLMEVEFDHLIGFICARLFSNQNNNKSLCFYDFIKGVSLIEKGDNKDRISLYFRLFDDDRDGIISINDITKWYQFISSEYQSKVEEIKINNYMNDKKVSLEVQEKIFDNIMSSPILKAKCERESEIFVESILIEAGFGETVTFKQFYKVFRDVSVLQKIEASIFKGIEESNQKFDHEFEDLVQNLLSQIILDNFKQDN